MSRLKIPKPIREQVRQRDGFGCVICGLGIIEYEHIIPYSDCNAHEVDNIILLCPNHHSQVTRGFLSKDKVIAAKKNPRCKQLGYTREILEFHDNSRIELAGNRFCYTQTILQIGKIPIIWINPGGDHEPAKLNAKFFDNTGNNTILCIKDNEWIADTNNWDIEATGGKLSIKDSQNNTNLVLDFKTKSPDILIKEWDAIILGTKIKCKDNVLTINNNTFNGCQFIGCTTGIQI